jgi:hypothetical protein
MQAGNAAQQEAGIAAELHRRNAAMERAKGTSQAERISEHYNRVEGSQIAAAGNSGRDPTVGSAALLTQETAKNSYLDQMSTLWNAESAAHSQDVSAELARVRGVNARRASRINAGTTLLTSLGAGFKGAGGRGGAAIGPWETSVNRA